MSNKAKIMFIEDEPFRNVNFIKLLNSRIGDLDIIQSDEEALELLRKYPGSYKYILLDIMMPSDLWNNEDTQHGFSTGIKLFYTLKNEGILDRIPLAILTNRINIPTEELKSDGASGCFIKPVDEDFYTWLETELNKEENKSKKQ